MALQARHIAKNFAFYLGSVAAVRVLNLILLPVFFLFIDKTDYGVFAVYLLGRQFIGYSLTLNGDWLLYEQFSKESPQGRRELVTHILLLSYLLIIISTALFAVAIYEPNFARSFFSNAEERELSRRLFPWLCADVLFMPLGVAGTIRLLAGFAKRSAVTEVMSSISGSLCSLLLMWLAGWKSEALVAGSLSSCFVMGVWNLSFLRTYLGGGIKLQVIVKLLKVGKFSASKNLGTFLIRRADQLFVAGFLGIGPLGAYAFAVRVFNYVEELFKAVGKAYLPAQVADLDKLLINDRAVIHEHQMLRAGLLVLAMAAFSGAYFFGEIALRLLTNNKISDIAVVISILAIAPLANTAFEHYANLIFIRGLFKLVPFVTLTSGAVGLLLAWVLIPRVGLVGAGLSQAGAHLTETFLYNFTGKRNWGVSIFPFVERQGAVLTALAAGALALRFTTPVWVGNCIFAFGLLLYSFKQRHLLLRLKTLVLQKISQRRASVKV